MPDHRSLAGRWILLLAVLLVRPAAAVQLGDITITGVKDEVLDNVRGTLSLTQQPKDKPITDARLAYLLEQVPQEVRRALEPFGFFDAEAKIDTTPAADRVAVTIAIAPGTPVKVRQAEIRIEGDAADDPILEHLHEAFRPQPGDVFVSSLYEDSKRAIQRGLLARGYFDAEPLRSRVEVTRAEHAADILLGWNSGPRGHFGELRIDGSQIDTDILRDRARQEVVPGDPFDQAKLLLMQQRLVELDYFSMVEVQPLASEATGAPPLVPIGVTVEPAKPNVYRIGLSYGTDHGAGVELGYDRRYLNRHGHKITSELQWAEKRRALAAQYRIPAFARFPGWWALGVRFDEERSGAIDSDIAGFLVSRSAEWLGAQWSLEAHLDRERYDDLEFDEHRYVTLVYPSLRYQKKHLDEPLYPRSGWSVDAQTRAGHTAIGSDVDFLQVYGRLQWVFGIGDWSRILVGGELGHTWGDSLERLPPSLRFYAGGDRSVRGYGYQELGPRNARDQVIGGRNLIAASVEFERMFTPEWGAAAFVDAGNAFNGNDFNPAVGVGIGLRWRSPIGPVRVDVAHGLDSPEQQIRLHLTLGPQL